jgi:Cu/Zn superoxide dismutase
VNVRRLTALLALAASFLTFVALAGTAAAASPITIQIVTQNNSGQAGTATLTDNGNGTTTVVVDTTGATAPAQPIHIHEGTCANLTPQVKYALTTTSNGKSESTVNVALSDLLATPHAINIHKSPQEAAVYVACGEIVAMPGATPSTGGGGMADRSSPLAWGAVAALLTITVVGATYALRRRAA